MATLDVLATVHGGILRTTPPGTSAEPQRDGSISAHRGFLTIYDGSEFTDDQIFCVVLKDDEDFEVALARDENFCVVLQDDEVFAVALQDDENFCVVLEDEDEVEL